MRFCIFGIDDHYGEVSIVRKVQEEVLRSRVHMIHLLLE